MRLLGVLLVVVGSVLVIGAARAGRSSRAAGVVAVVAGVLPLTDGD